MTREDAHGLGQQPSPAHVATDPSPCTPWSLRVHNAVRGGGSRRARARSEEEEAEVGEADRRDGSSARPRRRGASAPARRRSLCASTCAERPTSISGRPLKEAESRLRASTGGIVRADRRRVARSATAGNWRGSDVGRRRRRRRAAWRRLERTAPPLGALASSSPAVAAAIVRGRALAPAGERLRRSRRADRAAKKAPRVGRPIGPRRRRRRVERALHQQRPPSPPPHTHLGVRAGLGLDRRLQLVEQPRRSEPGRARAVAEDEGGEDPYREAKRTRAPRISSTTPSAAAVAPLAAAHGADPLPGALTSRAREERTWAAEKADRQLLRDGAATGPSSSAIATRAAVGARCRLAAPPTARLRRRRAVARRADVASSAALHAAAATSSRRHGGGHGDPSLGGGRVIVVVDRRDKSGAPDETSAGHRWPCTRWGGRLRPEARAVDGGSGTWSGS